jgi:hypothetical protein
LHRLGTFLPLSSCRVTPHPCHQLHLRTSWSTSRNGAVCTTKAWQQNCSLYQTGKFMNSDDSMSVSPSVEDDIDELLSKTPNHRTQC